MLSKCVSKRIEDAKSVFNFLRKEGKIERIIHCFREIVDKKNLELKIPEVDKDVIEVSTVNIFDNMGNHIRICLNTADKKEILEELAIKLTAAWKHLNLNIVSNISKHYSSYCLEIKITMENLPEEIAAAIGTHLICIPYDTTEITSTICKILDKVPILGVKEIENIMKTKDKNWNYGIHIESSVVPNKDKTKRNLLASIMKYGNLKSYTNTLDRIQIIQNIHNKCYNIAVLPTLSEDNAISILIRNLETSLTNNISFSMQI